MRAVLIALALVGTGAAQAESPTQFWLEQTSDASLSRRASARLPSLSSGARAAMGRASYYGGGRGEHLSAFTANGERFNSNGRTAASRTLRFGTRLEVTNLANGRSVVVRVSDRGPAASTGRDLDLSRGAAAQIGMLQSGVASVSFRILN